MSENQKMEQLAIDAIRVLTAESVQKAKSGHPGLAMGSAALGYELWAHHMKFNPADLRWIESRPVRPQCRTRIHAAVFITLPV